MKPQVFNYQFPMGFRYGLSIEPSGRGSRLQSPARHRWAMPLSPAVRSPGSTSPSPRAEPNPAPRGCQASRLHTQKDVLRQYRGNHPQIRAWILLPHPRNHLRPASCPIHREGRDHVLGELVPRTYWSSSRISALSRLEASTCVALFRAQCLFLLLFC